MKEAEQEATKKQKKIYFSEELDSRISGFSVVFAFILSGLVLQFAPNYFGNALVTAIVKWVFIIIGLLGTIVEIGKIKSSIYGLDDLLYGCLFLGGWTALFVFADHWVAHTLSFVILPFGAYEFARGTQLLLHSISQNFGKPREKKTEKGDILLILTKLLGVVLVIIQLCTAVMDLNLHS